MYTIAAENQEERHQWMVKLAKVRLTRIGKAKVDLSCSLAFFLFLKLFSLLGNLKVVCRGSIKASNNTLYFCTSMSNL